tara:strand:+ start:38 stop:877 length:840 start_codon:yes stop_codon:yes gene_type:complete
MFKLSNNQNNILIIIILVLFISQVFSTTKEGNTGSHIFYTNDLTSDDLDEMYQRKNKSLNLITSLDTSQDEEIKELFNYVTNTSDLENEDTEIEVKNKIKKIVEISNQKEGIYKDLSVSLKFLLDKYGQSRIDKVSQDANVAMIEGELKDLKEKTKEYKDNLSEKQKKTEINTYYLKRYQNLIDLTQTVCLYIFAIIIVMVLHVNELIGDNIKIGLMGFIGAIAIIHLGRKIVDFYFRNNTNFDEYDWPFNSNRDYGDGEPITVGYGDDDDDECEASNS